MPKIHSNITFPPKPRTSVWSLSFKSRDQIFACTSHVSDVCFNNPKIGWWPLVARCSSFMAIRRLVGGRVTGATVYGG